MKIAVVSDSHGNHATVWRALEMIRERGITTVLHCGDIDDAETVQLFAGLDAHFVFGNCDWDRAGLSRAMEEARVRSHDAWGQLELAGVKIAFLHGDDTRRKREIEESAYFDYLFYGHTHVAAENRVGPGRIFVVQGRGRRLRVVYFARVGSLVITSIQQGL